ncbi:MAG: mechanosensitive ion channel [Lachnospiraceae bacterium]|nr:mechanosensitive ion channel [Lachnospiraceae bacterium]
MTLEKTIDMLGPLAVTLVKNVLISLLIWFVGKKLITFALKLLDRITERSHMDLGIARFLHSAVYFILYAVLAFLIVSQLGINTSSVLTVISAGVVAIGMSLQGSLSNVAGGILLLLMRPFKVGDYIITDYGSGTVRMIGIVYTTLVTIDNLVITVPNGTLANTTVTDVAINDERKLVFNFGIAYDADLTKAKEIIREVLLAQPGVVRREEMKVFVNAWKDSSIELGAWLWIDRNYYFDVTWAVNEQVKLRFDAEGIQIPYPQVDVHLDKDTQRHSILSDIAGK